MPRACVFPFQAPLVLFVFCRCEVGTTHWTQCNETPVKFARFPVTGLIEGRSYIFRVRAVNKAGVSLPSRVSEPVAALDPADRARLRSKMSFLQLAFRGPGRRPCQVRLCVQRVLFEMFFLGLTAVHCWHRGLAKGEHRDSCEVPSLCSF